MPNKEPSTSRRSLLKAVGFGGAAGVATFSGCLGGDEGRDATKAGAGGTDTATPADQEGTTSGGKWPDLSGKQVHLVTESSKSASKKLFRRIAKEFESATGATVKPEFTGLESGTKRVAQLVQAGDPPELYQGVQFDTGSFRQNDILVPLTEVLDTVSSNLGTPQRSMRMKIDGEDWMVPGWSVHTTWYYRDDVTDVVPDTWDKLTQYAKQADGTDGINGTYIPAGIGGFQSYALMGWMASAGGQVMQWTDGKIEVAYDKGENRQKMIDVLNKRKELYQYSPVSSDAGYGGWSGAIAKNASYSTSYPGFRPVLTVWRQKHPAAKQVQPLPRGGHPAKGSGTPSASGAVVGYMAFKDANTWAAKTFLEFMYENHYMDLTTTLNPGHYTPVYPEVRGTDRYWQAVDAVFDERGWDISRKVLETYQDVDLIPRPSETDPPNPYAGVSYKAQPFLQLGSDALLTDMSAAKAIDKYAPKHQAFLDEAQS